MRPLTNMFFATDVQNVLLSVEFTTRLKEDKEKWCAIYHTCANLKSSKIQIWCVIAAMT